MEESVSRKINVVMWNVKKKWNFNNQLIQAIKIKFVKN